MGLFDKLRGVTGGASAAQPVSLEKEQKLSLKKEEVHKISLAKTSKNGAFPLKGLKARVIFALDFSGSMRNNFNNGTVQEILDNILPIAMEFDDDSQLEMWLFDSEFRRLPNVTIGNIEDYVRREIINKKWHMGGTSYAPVMTDITRYCVEANVKNGKMPAYVVFITDGSNADKPATQKIMKDASYNPIFWQFVGIGGESFPFLEKLDDLTDRNVDNADFFAVRDPKSITYNQLLNEFPEWLEYDKVKAMLR